MAQQGQQNAVCLKSSVCVLLTDTRPPRKSIKCKHRPWVSFRARLIRPRPWFWRQRRPVNHTQFLIVGLLAKTGDEQLFPNVGWNRRWGSWTRRGWVSVNTITVIGTNKIKTNTMIKGRMEGWKCLTTHLIWH